MLHLDGHAVVMPAPGTPVMNGQVQVGFLGTVARHHELGPIALALVKRNTPVDAQLMVEGVAAMQEIIVEA
jgi:folate-binding Fe-S cluster repair protein YgfZ